ncbi:hypothetical protein ACX0HA_08230 [Flavobacterium hauense]
MKNILIPTTLQQDTIIAVKAAIKHANESNYIITLMLVSDLPDAESASYFLRTTKSAYTSLQTQVLDLCHTEAADHPNCRLELHNRYGVSAPLLKNLLEHLGTGLIIVPPSYKQERDSIHHFCLNLLANSKTPILHLTEGCEEQEFNKALYLEHTTAQLGLQEVQQLIGSQFNFRIVSHAAVGEQYPNELGTQLTEAIAKNNIDLLIETRKPEKVRMKKRKEAYVNETLGLPVLSIFEEA